MEMTYYPIRINEEGYASLDKQVFDFGEKWDISFLCEVIESTKQFKELNGETIPAVFDIDGYEFTLQPWEIDFSTVPDPS